VLNPDRSLAVQLPAFAGGVVVTEWQGDDGWACAPQALAPDLPEIEAQRRALMLGIAQQVACAGKRQALLVLGGDPASARLAALAVEALGSAQVSALVMPGEDTPPALVAEAEGLARRLGIGCRSIPIAPAQAAFAAMLGTPAEASRIRAVTLATLAASLGAVPLVPSDWPDELGGLDRAAQPSSTLHGAEPGP
jgi:hypothetical protein